MVSRRTKYQLSYISENDMDSNTWCELVICALLET